MEESVKEQKKYFENTKRKLVTFKLKEFETTTSGEVLSSKGEFYFQMNGKTIFN
jgi:hypothetical protein